MNKIKIIWSIRAFIYSFFTKFRMPGYIGKPCFISSLKNIKFGKNVRIYPGLRAEICGKNNKIIIEDNVSIGQNFHVVAGDLDLVINKNVVISGNVFISNCEHEYIDVAKTLFEQNINTKETIIGENSFIGYGVVIQAGTKLGKNCIVGSNSILKGEYDDFSVIVGSPGKVIKKYNLITNKWERV